MSLFLIMQVIIVFVVINVRDEHLIVVLSLLAVYTH